MNEVICVCEEMSGKEDEEECVFYYEGRHFLNCIMNV